MLDQSPTAYAPPPLSPLQAHVDNMIMTRAQNWTVAIGQRTAALRAIPAAFPIKTAATLHFRCAENIWRVDFGSLEFIRSHSAIAQVPSEKPLPEIVLLAVLDLILTPILESLQGFMGDAVVLTSTDVATGEAADGKFTAFVHLILEFDDAGNNDAPIPVRIAIPDRQAALLLADRLAGLPVRSLDPKEYADLPVTVCIDAGKMRLSLNELSTLAQGDIILPSDYLGSRGMIMLRPCPSSSHELTDAAEAIGVLCAVHDTQATVVTAVATPQEMHMTTTDSSADVPAATENQAPLEVGNIEVELCFELERRTMTIKDLAALAPGYTFTLGCDPLAPVSLRINGTIIGSGRLVDINGVLGVQVNSLARIGGQDVRR